MGNAAKNGEAPEGESEQQKSCWIVDRLSIMSLGFLLLWLLKPSGYLIAVAWTVPPVVMAVVAFNWRHLCITVDATLSRKSLWGVIFAPVIILIGEAIRRYHFADWSLIIGASVAAGAIAVLGVALAERHFKLTNVLKYAVFYCAYGFGAVAQLNAVLPQAPPQIIITSVLEKKESSGWRMTLSPLPPDFQRDAFDVDQVLFDAVKVGDRVCIVAWSGAFKIKWHTVERCDVPHNQWP